MHVALVSVGDEILAGDTVNTNAAWLGQRLAARGVDVERVTVIPDRIEEIASVVSEYRSEYDAVIVTGGLGPTHDDLTMEGVAAALDRGIERNEEALSWLTEEGGYAREDLTAGTADLPAGARPLHNEAGVAPGAAIEGVYVLPGVPAEMKAMFETVETEFEGEPRYTSVVYTTEPESALVPRLEAVRDRFDVSVGSYPGDGVRLKLTGADEAVVESAADWLRERVELDE
ncbi:competence/damage-inducible protein A [Halalkalicoccus jeotgali]|uniref:Molybdopterin binding domain protein n=1 Tax=Halalkalicoccus jeotgali (strain DSM 18796 / CECT 7217 / JCM 14584 / KCTC 4019 / B3) TaxID=795797 RepID=D8J5F3_HALJB|nr:molybdopterin-binding protein [Halalkalicoccus jeotgali]ADJ15649.1 molybdopterin binding domain protein [Halalkalicoccus jeotgali B3]ELY36581.1 molybdopterin binding domain-containing protein [Halalkalicoccus jeotgali B3]